MAIIQANVTKRVGDEAGGNVGVDVGQFHQGNQGRPGVPGSIITGELVKGGKWITIQARLNPRILSLATPPCQQPISCFILTYTVHTTNLYDYHGSNCVFYVSIGNIFSSNTCYCFWCTVR